MGMFKKGGGGTRNRGGNELRGSLTGGRKVISHPADEISQVI